MRLLFSLVLILFALPAVAQAAGVTKILKVRDNIHTIVSPKGGNVVVSIGDDGTFLIDDQLTGRSEVIREAVRNLHGEEIKFILNTHYHFDHSGGNEFFGREGAIIVAHDNVRERLSTEQFITYFKREMAPLEKEGLPVVTFSEDMTLHYNDDSIRVTHVPNAHTDGDSIAYFMQGNVLVAGDVIFNGLYPFIDLEHGGSIMGVIAGLDRMLAIADGETVIVPGHGPLMTLEDLQAYRDMLSTIAGRIEDGIRAGKSKEEIIAAKPTQEFDEGMAEGIVSPGAFVGILYDDLSR